MSKNTLANLAIRNQILLNRYASAAVLEFDKIHPELEKAIGATLAQLEGDTLDTLTANELRGVLGELRVAQSDIQQEHLFKLTEELGDLGGLTAAQEATTLRAMTAAGPENLKISKATAKQAYKRALEQPMQVGSESTGMLLDSFMKGWGTKQIERVNGAVLQGWQQGKTVQQVMQQIRGTKKAGYKDGLTSASRREAAAMVRTATQHVAQSARMETWARNGDLVQGYEILATLDGRTTQICRSLDGRKYDLGKGPVPPFHVNCRTTTVPTLGAEWDFLDEGATRSSANGYVDADLTYYDWLKTQDPEFVKDALGASRAKLFLEGGLSSKEFGDLNLGKNFEPLTLSEMATRNPNVFRGTGLEKFVPDGIELLGDVPAVKPAAITKGQMIDKLDEPGKKALDWYLSKASMQSYDSLLGMFKENFDALETRTGFRFQDYWTEADHEALRGPRKIPPTLAPKVTPVSAPEQRGVTSTAMTQRKWEASLNDKQRASIEYWSETLETVTDVRRADAGKPPNNPKALEFLETIKGAPPYAGTVYRGKTITGEALAKIVPGETYTIRNLASTSKSVEVAEEFADYGMDEHKIVFKVETRKGVDISRLVGEDYASQDEVLLTHNLNFKIKSVKEDGEYIVVHLIE